MLELLKLLFSKQEVKPEPKVIEIRKCEGKDHVFINTPTGKARMEHRCMCRHHTWASYNRRWDRGH